MLGDELTHQWFQSFKGFIDNNNDIEYCQPCSLGHDD